MDTKIFLYIAAILFSCVLIVVFARPIRSFARLAMHSAVGGVLIVAFNFVSQLFGFFIGVNALTAITVGVLGFPGFVMLLMLQLILN